MATKYHIEVEIEHYDMALHPEEMSITVDDSISDTDLFRAWCLLAFRLRKSKTLDSKFMAAVQRAIKD